MKLSPSVIEQVARLSRLSLTDKEKKLYALELSVVLDYVESLNEVDTSAAPETNQVTGLEDVTRVDEIVSCSAEVRRELVRSFPETKGNLLVVPTVMNSDT